MIEVLDKAITIDQIGIWASGEAGRWLQLQSLLETNYINIKGEIPTNVETLMSNIKWLSEHTDYNSIMSILGQVNDEDLKKLRSVVGIMNFKNILKIWEENKTNDKEEFWQGVFLERPEIISQVFSYPIVILKDKAYIGGKSIENSGGKIADFLYQNNNTKNVIVVEIKTPITSLLESEYRQNVYSISKDLSGSVNQTLIYVNQLLKDYNGLVQGSEQRFEASNPRCLLIIGSLVNEGIVGEKRHSFETFRNDFRN